MEYSNGPNMEPCGTPPVTRNILDSLKHSIGWYQTPLNDQAKRRMLIFHRLNLDYIGQGG